VFVAAAAWSWRKWPELLIDFGRELYTPWQLADGKILYRDIAPLFGPFSQYFNALWFRIFGTSFTTLIFCNLAILAGVAYLTYRLFAAACDRLTATVACVVLLPVFGFSHYGMVGNYNFVSPYAHEATHSVALIIALIACLTKAMTYKPRLMYGLAGLCLGCIFLTRAETALAAGVMVMTWAVVATLSPSTGLHLRPAHAGVLVAMTIVPPLAFFIYFRAHLETWPALKAVGGAWSLLAVPGITNNSFYQKGMGLDAVHDNLVCDLRAFAVLGFAVIVASAIDLITRRWRRLHVVLGLLLGGAAAVVLLMKTSLVSWQEVGRPLPAVAILSWGGLLAAWIRRRRDAQAVQRLMPMILWAAFATVMLAKMVLKVRLYHYGFFLAMPAALLLVAGLLSFVPRVLGGASAQAVVFRGLALAAIAGGVGFHVGMSDRWYATQTTRVGKGGDLILTHPPEQHPCGVATISALEKIEQLMPKNATFVVLPEGVMLNYLSRRANPTPYINFMLIEMLAFGEDHILEAFRRARPDFFILVHKNTSEFGVGFFGQDPNYGMKIMRWVNAEYETAALIGLEPLTRYGEFGIKIMRRRAAAS
jgi:hypothetical protein